MSVSVADQQERIAYVAHPCPDCYQPMTAARVFDPRTQEAFAGAVCVPCNAAYRVVWAEGQEPERVLTKRSESQEAKGPRPDGDPVTSTPQTEGDSTK